MIMFGDCTAGTARSMEKIAANRLPEAELQKIKASADDRRAGGMDGEAEQDQQDAPWKQNGGRGGGWNDGGCNSWDEGGGKGWGNPPPGRWVLKSAERQRPNRVLMSVGICCPVHSVSMLARARRLSCLRLMLLVDLSWV